MNVIADTCAIDGRIVGPKYPEGRRLPSRGSQDVGNQVGFTGMGLAYSVLRKRSRCIEVTQNN